MPVFITDKHLKASDTRKTISDNKQLGFALRTTPNGVFTFYYQHLNKKTGKRDWHLIGSHPEWTPARARTEATRLAGLVASEKDIKQIRHRKIAQDRAECVSFQQVHDEYVAYCKQPVDRRWGTVPRKETWRGIQYSLDRPLKWWGDRVASEITSADIKELYESYVREKHPAQANMVRGNLRTMFTWAMHDFCGSPKSPSRREPTFASSGRWVWRVKTLSSLPASYRSALNSLLFAQTMAFHLPRREFAPTKRSLQMLRRIRRAVHDEPPRAHCHAVCRSFYRGLWWQRLRANASPSDRQLFQFEPQGTIRFFDEWRRWCDRQFFRPCRFVHC